MANVLRELIARVVLRVDDASLQRLDTKLDQARAKLVEFQTEAERGTEVKVDVNSTEAERSLSAIRVALGEMGSAVDPAALANLREQFGAASKTADDLRLQIDRLKVADPDNPRIAELARQLGRVESEARQTAAALDKTTESAKRLPGVLGKIQENWGKLGAGLQTLGLGLGVAGLTAFLHQTLEAAGAVEDLADRLGMGIEEVQVWSAFAKRGGADTEALSASMKGLANAMQGAASGGKEQRAAFEALGIKTDAWKKGLPSLTETLALVGGKLGEVDNEGQRLALTQKLLSEGGLKLAPAFKGGTKAVEEQLEKLKELAIVYDEDFVKAAGEAGDELDLFKAQLGGLGSELVLMVLPAIRGAVRELTPFLRSVRDSVKNSAIFKGILGATGITALASFGGMSGLMARIAPLLRGIVVAAAPFIWAFAKFALLALIIDDLWVTLNGGKSVIGEVFGKFETGRKILDAMQGTFKLLKGSVMLLWGALSGDQDSIDKGKALIDEFSVWADNAFADIQDAWDSFWSDTFPGLVDGGLDSSGASIERSLDDWYTLIGQWANKTGEILSDVWSGAIDGLLELIRLFGDLLAMIPGLEGLGSGPQDRDYSEWQPISPSAQKKKDEMVRARNAAVYGADVNPFVFGSGTSSSVNVTYNQQFETSIETRNERETLAAVYKTEQNYTSAMKDNRKTLRHVVGATR